MTPAHKTTDLAEIVCSNTFKSLELGNAHGVLKAELGLLGSLLIACAHETRVPGGAALTVDRHAFSHMVTRRIESHPNIRIERREISELPSPGIVATGPLTSNKLAEVIAARLGVDSLAFYDAIAPIVSADSLDESVLYRRSRYGKGDGADYWNAPFDRAQYEAFIDALTEADQHAGHDFDTIPYFEGCLPIEEMARRGRDTPRFGPMKPVGLEHPETGKVPYAAVQLRQEDRHGQMWNLVGFQTRLRIPEQKRVFRSIPGLADAEFFRYGSVHRNTYLNSPEALSGHLSLRDDRQTLFAGQLVGVEGYTESLATGLLAGINLARLIQGDDPALPPDTTMLGALMRYVTTKRAGGFQPMNANFGLLPPLEHRIRDKAARKQALAARALEAMESFSAGLEPVAT